MLQKLRQVLLTQYIGAIVVAIVGAQCVQTFVSLLISLLWHLVIVVRTPAGALGESRYQAFDWAVAIYNLVTILSYAAVVYGLMRWLYVGHQVGALQERAETDPPAPETTERSS